MDKDLASRALGSIVIVLAVMLVIGVLTFASGCVHDDGTVSICHGAQIAIAVSGVAIAILAAIALAIRNPKVSGIALIVAAAGGVFAAVAPGTVFPLCMMTTMRCHLVMQPFAQFLGVAIAAISLIAGIRAFRIRG